MRLLSAEAQRLAPPGSTYGYDVLVRIGWLRQHQRATIARCTAISPPARHLRSPCALSLSALVFTPAGLPRGQQRGDWPRSPRSKAADHRPGWPRAQGASRKLVYRDLSTGLTLRSGCLLSWISHVRGVPRPPEAPGVANFGRTQRQTNGLVPAVATVLPNSRHQFCQVHYLRNLAEPLAAADAPSGELANRARAVGDVIRQEPGGNPAKRVS